MDLSWDHFNSILQTKTHLWPQTQQFGYVGFQEKSNTPSLKPTKSEPSFTKSSTHPLQKLGMLLHVHLQGWELSPQTNYLSLLLEWSQVTHILAIIKICGIYKPSTFARQLCDDTCLPGCLSAFPAPSQTFKPTLASFAHTQIGNRNIQWVINFSVLFFLHCNCTQSQKKSKEV